MVPQIISMTFIFILLNYLLWRKTFDSIAKNSVITELCFSSKYLSQNKNSIPIKLLSLTNDSNDIQFEDKSFQNKTFRTH